MSKNKKIGFDVLENSDINTIEQLGTDKMNIDKSARDRMLKNTMQKYENEKQRLGISQDMAAEYTESADSVTGVEMYDRKKVPHIIYIALCSAAAIALAVGSIAMFSRQKNITPDIKNPIAEITSTASTATVTSASATASIANSAITSKVTGAETTTAQSTTADEASTTADVTETASVTKQTNTAISAPYKNPHTDRTDISREELEAASVRAVRGLIRDNTEFQNLNPQMEFTFSYAFYDVNADSVPELFITKRYILQEQYMYVYDGNEYVLARFNGHDIDGNEKLHDVTIDNIDVFTEKNTIAMLGHQAGAQSFILYMEADNTITPLHEYTYYRYYENGKLTEENLSDTDLLMFKRFCDVHETYERVDLNWTVYNDINNE